MTNTIRRTNNWIAKEIKLGKIQEEMKLLQETNKIYKNLAGVEAPSKPQPGYHYLGFHTRHNTKWCDHRFSCFASTLHRNSPRLLWIFFFFCWRLGCAFPLVGLCGHVEDTNWWQAYFAIFTFWLLECVQCFGLGSVAQSVLSDSKNGQFLSINFGWGLGVALGCYSAGGISGAHMNPAVTLAMTVHRRLPWKKFPVYIAGQMLGSFLASTIVYFVYYGKRTAFETFPC